MIANMTTPTEVSITTNRLLTLKPHNRMIVNNIDIERNTLPKYEKSLANIAHSTVFEIDSKKYPVFTIETEMYKSNSQGSLFRIKNKYPTNKTIDIIAIMAYVIIN